MTGSRRSQVKELRSLDLNLLVALRALLDEQHVSRAAEVTGVTQSGMSRALQRLRTMFNDQLLVKVDHGYELTNRALEIDAALDMVLTGVQRLMVAPSFNPIDDRGEFRIASFDYELLVLMPAIISALRKRAPGITINAINLRTIDFNLLMRGEVDLVFSAFANAPPNLYRKKIFEEDKVCLLSANHLCSDTEFTLETFRKFDHVWVNINGPDPGMIDETLEKHGYSRNISVMAPSFLLAARIVAQTNLMAILPRRISTYFLNNKILRLVSLPFSFPKFSIYQYWHERSNDNPRQQWFRKLVSEVSKSL